MLLKRISYHNFRPFIGDQEIILTPDDEKASSNVVVILGTTHSENQHLSCHSFGVCMGKADFPEKMIF